MERSHFNNNTDVSLGVVLLKITMLWGVSNLGYYLIFPALGISLSYNAAPFAIAGYFFVWALFSALYFWDILSTRILARARPWIDVVHTFIYALVATLLLYIFSKMSLMTGPSMAPYSDLLFASPWYFLPKAAEILVQQVLIVVLILKLSERITSLFRLLLIYAFTFGSIHLSMYVIVGAPMPYGLTMTIAALISTIFFPYLILRIHGGVVYTYMIHLLFYIILAMLLHVWPPPDYLLIAASSL
jgi:hypothetical protein